MKDLDSLLKTARSAREEESVRRRHNRAVWDSFRDRVQRLLREMGASDMSTPFSVADSEVKIDHLVFRQSQSGSVGVDLVEQFNTSGGAMGDSGADETLDRIARMVGRYCAEKA